MYILEEKMHLRTRDPRPSSEFRVGDRPTVFRALFQQFPDGDIESVTRETQRQNAQMREKQS